MQSLWCQNSLHCTFANHKSLCSQLGLRWVKRLIFKKLLQLYRPAACMPSVAFATHTPSQEGNEYGSISKEGDDAEYVIWIELKGFVIIKGFSM